jgi:hypothetical protein
MQNHEEGGDHSELETDRPGSATPTFELDSTSLFAFKGGTLAAAAQESSEPTTEKEGVAFLPSGAAAELVPAPVQAKVSSTDAIAASPPRMRPSPIGLPETERDLSADDPFLAGVVESLNVEGDASPLFRPKKVPAEEMLHTGSFDTSKGTGGGGNLETSPNSTDMERQYESSYLYNRSFSRNNDTSSPFLEGMHSDRPGSAASLDGGGLRPGSLASWPLHPNINVPELNGNQNSLFDQIGPKGGHSSPNKTKPKREVSVGNGSDEMGLNMEFGGLNSGLGGMDLQRGNGSGGRSQNSNLSSQNDSFGYTPEHGEPFRSPRKERPGTGFSMENLSSPHSYPQQGDTDVQQLMSFDGKPLPDHVSQTINSYANPDPTPSQGRGSGGSGGAPRQDSRAYSAQHSRQPGNRGEQGPGGEPSPHEAYDPNFPVRHMLHPNEMMAAQAQGGVMHSNQAYGMMMHPSQQPPPHSVHAFQPGISPHNLPYHLQNVPYMNNAPPMDLQYDPRYGYPMHDAHGIPQPFPYGESTERKAVDSQQQAQSATAADPTDRRNATPQQQQHAPPASRVVAPTANVAMMPMQGGYPGVPQMQGHPNHVAPGMQTSHMTIGPDGNYHHIHYMPHPGMPSAGGQPVQQPMHPSYASNEAVSRGGNGNYAPRRGGGYGGGAPNGGGGGNYQHPNAANHNPPSSNSNSGGRNGNGQNQRSRGQQPQQQSQPQNPNAANYSATGSQGGMSPQQQQHQAYMQSMGGNAQRDARNPHQHVHQHQPPPHHNQAYPHPQFAAMHNLSQASQAHINYHPQMMMHNIGPPFQGLNQHGAPNNLRNPAYAPDGRAQQQQPPLNPHHRGQSPIGGPTSVAPGGEVPLNNSRRGVSMPNQSRVAPHGHGMNGMIQNMSSQMRHGMHISPGKMSFEPRTYVSLLYATSLASFSTTPM